MMSDLSFVVVVPLTGPVTPVVVFPVVPIGPLLPGGSTAYEEVIDKSEKVVTKIAT
jgi:hypothetical protein